MYTTWFLYLILVEVDLRCSQAKKCTTRTVCLLDLWYACSLHMRLHAIFAKQHTKTIKIVSKTHHFQKVIIVVNCISFKNRLARRSIPGCTLEIDPQNHTGQRIVLTTTGEQSDGSRNSAKSKCYRQIDELAFQTPAKRQPPKTI